MSDPSKAGGTVQWAQGKAEEAVGNVTGAKDWQASGKEKVAKGDSEYKAAEAKGYAEGTKDRIGGKKDELIGKVTGNDSKEAGGKARNAAGDLKQDINK